MRTQVLFIYFWLHWVFIAACGLSLVVVSRGFSLWQCMDFSLRWLLSCCRAWTLGTLAQWILLRGSRACALQLWCMSLAALWHVGYSWTRARTCVSCIGRRTTRETRPSFESGHLGVHSTWGRKHTVPLTYLFLREGSSWGAFENLAYLFSRRLGIILIPRWYGVHGTFLKLLYWNWWSSILETVVSGSL